MKFELVRVVSPDKIKDGQVTIAGPDIPDLKEGANIPYGVVIEPAQPSLHPVHRHLQHRRKIF
nr:hypothetical protein [Candidatus Sigynarchaeum springense]